jgi:hypothetical protein
MKYFLPDSQDLVDPSFDFEKETRSVDRVRHQDDHYAHEVFSARAFDGILISKAMVDGTGGAGQAKYTQAQKRRILREGVRAFFRTDEHRWGPLTFMGDCGAFTYVKEEKPPYTVEEVIEFYEKCGFDYGISVDHVILEYRPQWEEGLFSGGDHGVPPAIRERQELTLQLASEFYKTAKRDKLRFTPVGVVQGWGPRSFAYAATELQKMGYRYIALGGMVPLKTPDILSCLKAVHPTRKPDTQLHLLGVTRLAQLSTFADYGVVSFDSTSPLRQAWMDDKDNYHTIDRTYTAIRVPQVQGNFRLEARIRSGEIDQDVARKAELRCLQTLAEYDAGKRAIKTVLEALRAYELIHDPRTDRTEIYREVLEARPWKMCACEVCKQLKHHVILFRGAERNRRRGFHNVWVFYQRLTRGLGGELQTTGKRSPRAKSAAASPGNLTLLTG